MIWHWKKIMWAIVALAIVSLGVTIVAAVRDYASTKERLGVMETAVEVQNATITAQRQALDEWREWREAQEARLEELSDVSREARQNVAETRRELSGIDYETIDDETLGRVVNGIDARARCLLEAASGGDRNCPGED